MSTTAISHQGAVGGLPCARSPFFPVDARRVDEGDAAGKQRSRGFEGDPRDALDVLGIRVRVDEFGDACAIDELGPRRDEFDGAAFDFAVPDLDRHGRGWQRGNGKQRAAQQAVEQRRFSGTHGTEQSDDDIARPVMPREIHAAAVKYAEAVRHGNAFEFRDQRVRWCVARSVLRAAGSRQGNGPFRLCAHVDIAGERALQRIEQGHQMADEPAGVFLDVLAQALRACHAARCIRGARVQFR